MYECRLKPQIRHSCTCSDRAQRLLFFDGKLENLAPTLFNQPSLPFQFSDPLARIFFRHTTFLSRGVLDRILDAEGHFVGRTVKREAINILKHKPRACMYPEI